MGGSIQMSLKENKNKKKVKGFADQKHKSHRLKNLEEKRRKRFFKMKSNMRDQEIKSRADTTLDQDMRYIDVVKVSGRGETVKLSKNEYKELTSHKKVGTKKRRTIKHSYQKKKKKKNPPQKKKKKKKKK